MTACPCAYDAPDAGLEIVIAGPVVCSVDGVAGGSHTLEVRATSHPQSGDLVQITAISDSVVVDTTHPDVSIDSHPVSLSNDRTPAFTFSSTDNTATFQCKVDSGDWATCASGDHIASQSDGDHTFSVRAKDPATNVTEPPASYTWEIDSHGPVVSVTSGPLEGGVTNARKPTWGYTVAVLLGIAFPSVAPISTTSWS